VICRLIEIWSSRKLGESVKNNFIEKFGELNIYTYTSVRILRIHKTYLLTFKTF